MSKAMEYAKALLQVQSKGVMIVENVMNCCRGCSSAEFGAEFPGTDYAYSYAGQGREIRWSMDDDLPYEYDEDDRRTGQAGRQYWNFSTAKAAAAVNQAFREHGFTVDWDGTEMKCVTVDYSRLEAVPDDVNEAV